MKIETFGLPMCLQIPIAAASIEKLEGTMVARKVARSGRINAVLLRPHLRPVQTPNVKLWLGSKGPQYFRRLHPDFQVWVHVDFNDYRKAWREFKMRNPRAHFLDQTMNRRSTRLLRNAHPYLRLTPVSHRTNTEAGGVMGGEGRQHTFLSNLSDFSAGIQEEVWKANEPPLKMADPMDLMKMLNRSTGTVTLDGERQPTFVLS